MLINRQDTVNTILGLKLKIIEITCLHFFITIIIIFISFDICLADNDKQFSRYSFEYEVDAYYSNAGIYLNITDEPIENVGEKPEFQVYRDLFLSSYIPRVVVLEAAVFPMPVIGVYLKKNMPHFYEEVNISEELNLIEAVTGGFEQPFALSLFLGNVIKFSKHGDKRRHGNLGYMGYLLSVNENHIKNNVLINDRSYEVEWKVKGDREFLTNVLKWSFRVGARFHENKEIRDVIYLGLRRSRLDFKADANSILKNSGFEYVMDIDNETMKPLRHYFTVDKKWPLKKKRLGVSLNVGFTWQNKKRYSGSLVANDNVDQFQTIIRPNLNF